MMYHRLINPKPGTPYTLENVHICLNCVHGMTALRYGDLTCRLDGVTKPDHAGCEKWEGRADRLMTLGMLMSV
jgi:hypothetical protein